MKLSEEQAAAVRLMAKAGESNQLITGMIFSADTHKHDPSDYYRRYNEIRKEIDAFVHIEKL